MAKGDYVKIALLTPTGPYEARITVTTRGRRLKQTLSTKAKVQWVTFAEVMPSGKGTGDFLTVRQDAILSMHEHKEPAP